MFKRAEITRGTRGTNHPQPTGGETLFWGQDLKLFEINVATARDYVPPVAAIPTVVIIPRAAVAPPAAEPQAEPETQPEPAPAATAGHEELPKTASSMPLVALFGALFVGAGIALRAFRGLSGRVDM